METPLGTSPGRGDFGFSAPCMRFQTASSSLLQSLLASPSWHFVESGYVLYPASWPAYETEQKQTQLLVATLESATAERRVASSRGKLPSPSRVSPPGCMYSSMGSSSQERTPAAFLSIGPVTLASQVSLPKLEKQWVYGASTGGPVVGGREFPHSRSGPVRCWFSPSRGASLLQASDCFPDASALFDACSRSPALSGACLTEPNPRCLLFPAGACVCVRCGDVRSAGVSRQPDTQHASPLRHFVFVPLIPESLLPIQALLVFLRAHGRATGRLLAPARANGEPEGDGEEPDVQEEREQGGEGHKETEDTPSWRGKSPSSKRRRLTAASPLQHCLASSRALPLSTACAVSCSSPSAFRSGSSDSLSLSCPSAPCSCLSFTSSSVADSLPLLSESLEPPCLTRMDAECRLGVAICLGGRGRDGRRISAERTRNEAEREAAAGGREVRLRTRDKGDYVEKLLNSVLLPLGRKRNRMPRGGSDVCFAGETENSLIPHEAVSSRSEAAQARRERILYTFTFADFDALRTNISFKRR
ncbi:conserved hypothetical protein [Neospora caninum Liverpool]|uniref:Uncharacterized protein n=1 Tax=Neospora caninum (strain Liverpool) TaxID=572307 RepID=F0V9D4_NEOCL|nr:conserved hypothetical protein [Neospora caninum Liverpool]CBZ50359.1 conserved hypothetical protein [Neospora caninum Liverpool]CEL64965.1 TPA: hypothetical protein BN1204_008290 [Neospora caninum Liverpool]|eukprot:XP_003880393.1 conserved hypothetical protein [Neospora caninum Liverpool]